MNCFKGRENSFYEFIVITSLLAALMLGCVRGANKDTNTDPESQKISASNKLAMFTTNQQGVTGTSVQTGTSSVWGTPTKMRYSFNVCFQGKARNLRLPYGLSFQIVTENGLIYKDETDEHGCLQWEENLPFNFFADSKYLTLTRTFKSTNTEFTGSFVNRLAINPWIKFRNESGKEVIDLERNSDALPENVKVEGLAGYESVETFNSKGSFVELFIDGTPNIRFQSKADVSNTKLIQSSIQFKPFVLVKNMFGQAERFYFERGKFDIFLQVIVNDLDGENGMSLRLTPDSDKTIKDDVPINANGEVNHEFRWILTERVNTGNLHVAIKVIPGGGQLAQVNTVPFEAKYLIGEYEQIFSNPIKYQVTGTMKSNNNDNAAEFSYADYIKDVATTKETREKGLSTPLTPVVYGELFPRFVQIEPGETAMSRTVSLRVQTQVTDGVESTKTEKGQKFTIYKRDLKDPEKVPVPPKYNAKTGVLEGGFEAVKETESLMNGVINWTDQITHEYYIPEKYYFREYVIRHHLSNNIQSMSVAINPWDDKWTFGADLNGDQREEIIARNLKPKREPRFMIDAFRYQTIRFRYEIDQFMTLNVKKAVVMALDPLVQRDRITEGRSFLPLRDGIYLVKIALVRHYIDPFKSGVHMYRDSQTGEHKISKRGDGGDMSKGIYTTVVKKLLRVQAGRITTPLEFSMRDLRMMSIRSNIMVQIQPVDEHKLFAYNILNENVEELGLDYDRYHNIGSEERKDFLIKKLSEKLIEEINYFIENNVGQKKTFLSESDYKALKKLEKTKNQNSDVLKIVQAINSELNQLAHKYAVMEWEKFDALKTKKDHERKQSQYLRQNLHISDYDFYQKIGAQERANFIAQQSKNVANDLNNILTFLGNNKKALDEQSKKVTAINDHRQTNLQPLIEGVADLSHEDIMVKRQEFYNQTRDEFQSYMRTVRKNYEGLEFHLLAQRQKNPVQQFEIAKDKQGNTFYRRKDLDYEGGSLRDQYFKDPQNQFSPMALEPAARIGWVDDDQDNPTGGESPLIQQIDNKDMRLGEAFPPSSRDTPYTENLLSRDVSVPATPLPPVQLRNARSSSGKELIYSPSAYDFIGAMNNYMSYSGISDFTTVEQVKAMELNDYTSRPAAPLVDLDNLVYQFKEDAHLALKSRTFIGPCTLVADDNMSEMRPTDTIDEKYCDRVDCSQDLLQKNEEGLFSTNAAQESFLDTIQPKADNSEFESSAYHGSVAPFADMSVDNIIKMHIRLENNYVKEMTALSQIGRYVETNNLLYTTLSNPDLNKPAENDLKNFVPGCDYDKKGDECFRSFGHRTLVDGTIDPIYQPEDVFLQRLNENSKEAVVGIKNILSASPVNTATLIRQNIDQDNMGALKEKYENAKNNGYSQQEYKDYRLEESEAIHIEKLLHNTFLYEDYVSAGPIIFNGRGNSNSNPYLQYYEQLENDGIIKDPSLTTEHIREWLDLGAGGLKVWQVPQLCRAMANNVAERYQTLYKIAFLENLSDSKIRKLAKNLYQHCTSSSVYLPHTNKVQAGALQFHKQYKIKQTGKFEHISGKNMNLALGKEFAVASFNSKSSDRADSFNKVALLGTLGVAASVILPGVSAAAAGAGAIAAAGIGSMALTDITAQSLGYTLQDASVVEASTFLVVQQAEVKIQLLAYEKCMILGLNKGFYLNPEAKQLKKEAKKLGLKLRDYKPQIMSQAMERGHMVCEGKTTTKPINEIEKYYYVTQHFTAGDILDNGSLLNHVWLLSLRGEADFLRFTQLVGAKEISPEGKEVGFSSAVYPLDVLGKAYSQVRPSFPGILTIK